ncbi:alpha-2,8-polysialyltransferase family protein [Sinorhizobium fredii]|uniref:alpha-2,8-polysialyltransferase family protein n=1 Tax=Rhizobium fredii TaxID=380 RepID=UPI0005955F2D|nr:alpha-2,8-polysialyltransferase family protein [Sinorhizobium fredii]WOS65242.1 alpha-2,8-polysialyltransferase family protein [Sinorhizobium fredii GR64]
MTSAETANSSTRHLPAGVDLIVLSNGRQAQNALAFIDEFKDSLGLQPFILALYTDANLKERRTVSNLLIERNIAHDLLQLPIGAAYFSIRKQGRILRAYRSVFSTHKPRRLFLFNYNTHYGLAYDLARKAQIQVFFLEEGLSSYKNEDTYAPPRSITEIIDRDIIADSFFGKLLLKAPYELIANPKSGILNILRFLQKEVAFFARCIVVPFDNDLTASRLEGIFNKSYRYRRFHEPVSNFDGVFGTFPDRLARRFSTNEKRYFSYIKHAFRLTQHHSANRLADAGLTNRSVLYVDQAYNLDKSVVVGVIAKWICENFPEADTLYIKPHPKSDFSFEKLEALRRTHPEFGIKLLPYTDIPAEFIPALTECRKIIGIASTTLVYAQDLCAQVEAFSIYRRLLPLIASDPRTAKIVKEHGSILEDFPGVRFV